MIKTVLLSTITALTLATPALALDYPGHRPAPTGGGNPTISNQSQFTSYCHTSQVASDYWLRKDGFDCKVSSRTNVNGHKVWDITDRHGWKTTVVLWTDGVADVIQSNGSFKADWTRGSDGRVEIYAHQGEYSMAFPTR